MMNFDDKECSIQNLIDANINGVSSLAGKAGTAGKAV